MLRHACDNPLCCNPDHLLTGTQQDNINDKVARGRQAKGEAHGMSKLTTKQVERMRALRNCGWTLARLASEFDTSQSNVSSICRHLTRQKG